ncbi:MAG TPA: PQQ-binding-like beta-propeller repeat protein, partial [bacterium]|nr:PQQ-binding-like beta-propeller repeat protein [bacterium]
GDAAFTLDGTVKDLFDLQSKIAAKFCAAIGVSATASAYNFEDAMNLTAQQSFGEGMNAFYKHDYKKAIDFFRQALNSNEGSFYASAHTMEGTARQKQIESAAAGDQDKLKKEYLEQFRTDASQAAPAFYDLGTAYKATENWSEAIKAYSEFLKYAGTNAKVVLWKKVIKGGCFTLGDNKVYAGTDGPPAMTTYDLESGNLLSELKLKGEFVCRDLMYANGHVIWDGWSRIMSFDPTKPDPLWTYKENFDERSPLLIGNGVLAWLSEKTIYGVDLQTGKKLWSTSSETKKPSGILLNQKTAYVNNDGNFERDAYVSKYDFTTKKASRAGTEKVYAIGPQYSLYLSSNYVKGIENETGNQSWSVWDTDISPKKQQPHFQMAVADSQRFYLVSRDADITSQYSESGLSKKFIVGLDAATGNALWYHAVDGFLSSQMVSSHGLLFVATRYGNAEKYQDKKRINIYALDAVTGEKVWNHEVPEQVTKLEVKDDYLLAVTERNSDTDKKYVYTFRITNMKKPLLLYSDLDARFQHAYCLLKSGDLAAAEMEARELLELKNDYLPAYYLMSLVHRVRGNAAEELAALHEYYLRGNFEVVKERVYELSGIKQIYRFPKHEKAYLAKKGSSIFLKIIFGTTTDNEVYELKNEAVLYTKVSHSAGPWGDTYNEKGNPAIDSVRSTEYSFNYGGKFQYNSWVKANGYGNAETTPFTAYQGQQIKWRLDFLTPYYDGWRNGNRGCYLNATGDLLYISAGDGLVHAVDLKKVDTLIGQGQKWWKE